MTGPSGVDVRGVILGWEKLRVLYNVALAAVSLAVLSWAVEPEVRTRAFWASLVIAALKANLLYTLGPATEIYLAYLGRGQRWFRPAAFTAGLAVSAMAVPAIILFHAREAG